MCRATVGNGKCRAELGTSGIFNFSLIKDDYLHIL